MDIREYKDTDTIGIAGLLQELQQYIIGLDPDGLNIIAEDFTDVYTNNMLQKIEKGNGKVYVAEADAQIVGFIAGNIESFDEDDRVTYQCPVEGRILELFVTQKFRDNSIGTKLMSRMEEYFRSCNCEMVRVNVFAYNSVGMNFYNSHQYKTRSKDLLKKL